MILFKWLKELRTGRDRPPEVLEARELAVRISQKADNLQKILNSYQQAPDPFTAFMADLYNKKEVLRIHRGLNGGRR